MIKNYLTYIKEQNHLLELDPYGEDDWDTIEARSLKVGDIVEILPRMEYYVGITLWPIYFLDFIGKKSIITSKLRYNDLECYTIDASFYPNKSPFTSDYVIPYDSLKIIE